MGHLASIAAGLLACFVSLGSAALAQEGQGADLQTQEPEQDHPLLVLEAARAAQAAGEHARARELVLVAIDRALPILAQHEEPTHLCLCAIGRFAHQAGELRGAERFRRAVVELSERTLPADHPELQAARGNLAATIRALGDLHGARALQEAVLEVFERTLPEDHPDLQRARHNLALTMEDLGDLHGARALQEAVLGVRSRTLPADHPDLQSARANLAVTMKSLGDLHGARSLEEAVLEVRTRTLPEDHPDLQRARNNLALTIKVLGDLHGARALQEAVLEARTRTLPEDHPDLQRARLNLAGTIKALGDLHGARVLEEAVLEVRTRTLPGDHPDLQKARNNLAVTIEALGDLHGARALQEAVFEVRSRTLPEDHPDLQTARGNLAGTLGDLGDLHGARALQEAGLEVVSRTLPEDHPDLQRARGNLALTMKSLGDLHRARSLEEAVLEVLIRTLPADHPNLQTARLNLAGTIEDLGDLAGARALQEQVFEVLIRTLPEDHRHLQTARLNLARTLARLAAGAARGGESQGEGGGGGREGDGEEGWPRALALLADAARCARSAAGTTLWTASVREAEDRVAHGAERPLRGALSFAAGLGRFEPTDGLLSLAFELSEGTRAAGLAGVALARAQIEPATRDRLRGEIRAAGEELAALAQRGATREEYHRARTRREAAERELVVLARERAREGLGALDVSVGALTVALGPERALVGFRRCERWWLEEAPQEPAEAQFKYRSRVSLGAFVLRAEGGEPRLAFVDLGPMAELESLVGEWRGAIRATPERGLGLKAKEEDPALALGRRLRRAVWDPLAEALGDARHVVVALDDVLHLVPLDALPLDEGAGLVGDRWRVETRVALWELLDAPRLPLGQVALVSLGGASFHAEPVGLAEEDLAGLEPGRGGAAEAASTKAVSLLRGGSWERGFRPLPASREEARGLAELFEDVFEGAAPALVLDRARASREALALAAPKARYLHVATHGWFAPESVRSWADSEDSSRHGGVGSRLGGVETVRGMSPMLLCGLALAGANLPPNAVGRVPGLMTAEELSGLDLTGCELAVLSACDTNVGERRAGQGVASLQKALHMAGARSVITSLWKVPDEATAELMLDFYRRLWVEKKPKHQALWEAKLRLRDAKDERGTPLYTTRDWAAWVLTGEPE